LPWSKHIVIYDTLMAKSSPAEVEAVLGHELGHWYFCASHVDAIRSLN
jgi:STE24 endopeptidase